MEEVVGGLMGLVPVLAAEGRICSNPIAEATDSMLLKYCLVRV
jgi:hypothetical protein